MMNIYKISQDERRGYDTYDSAVVVAENEEEARNMHPQEIYNVECIYDCGDWASKPEYVKVELLGSTDLYLTKCVVVASFNAG